MDLKDAYIGKIVRITCKVGDKIVDRVGHIVGLDNNKLGEVLLKVEHITGHVRSFHPDYVREVTYEVVLDLKSSEDGCTESLGVYSTRAEAELIGKTWMGKGCYPPRGETGKVYRVVDARVI